MYYGNDNAVNLLAVPAIHWYEIDIIKVSIDKLIKSSHWIQHETLTRIDA